MKRVIVPRYGGPEVLTVVEEGRPTPGHVAIKVPDDVDPAVLVSVIFPYMTAYQLIHRAARARVGETALYHGAAGRVGVALLELAKPAGLRVYGTAATSDCALVERLGGVPIDYTTEDFLTRVRTLAVGGVDVVFDGIGGSSVISLLPSVAARWQAGALRSLLNRCAGPPQLDWPGQDLRLRRRGNAGGASLAVAAGDDLSDRKTARPPPRLVPRRPVRTDPAAARGATPPGGR